jgi:hypothetical protein
MTKKNVIPENSDYFYRYSRVLMLFLFCRALQRLQRLVRRMPFATSVVLK